VESIPHCLPMCFPDIASKHCPCPSRPVIWLGTVDCPMPQAYHQVREIEAPRCMMSKPHKYGKPSVEDRLRPENREGLEIPVSSR
jgi:hypothetical protein